jgi:hypothetical protein
LSGLLASGALLKGLSKPQPHGKAGRIRITEKKKSITTSRLKPETFRIVA